MSTTHLTGRLARAAARRPWLTLGVWAVMLAAALASASTIADHVTSDQLNLRTTEADRADDLDQQYRLATDEERASAQIVVHSGSLTYGQPGFDDVLARAVDALRAVDGVADVVTPTQGAQVAPGGHAALVDFTLPSDHDAVRAAGDAVAAVSTGEVEAFVYSTESVQLALADLAQESLARGEGIGIVVALVVLVFVFGALLAAGLPLVVALVSILAATGLSAVAAGVLWDHGVQVSDSLTIFTGMMGLALGIDYSLLTVQRFREELGRGLSVLDAIEATGNTANRAVLVSGGTVVISIGGLLLLPLNTFFGIGLAIIAVALTSVAAALTLLPALLRLLGRRVNALRIPGRHPGGTSRVWTRLATAVADRPGRAALAGVGVLALVAAPLATLRFAMPDPSAWPDDFLLHRANDVFVEDFGWTDSTTTIALTGVDGHGEAVAALASAVEADPGFAGATVDLRGDVAFIDTHDAYSMGEAASAQAIDRLRDVLIPHALGGTDVRASVGGARAYQMDEMQLVTDASPWVVAFILGATFVLLLVMFRSVVVPLKALLMNVVGTAATFGALVAIYQWGWGSAIGLPSVEGVSPYMPVMIFALVFGLSMDYHVFLLSRIRERYEATGSTRLGVIEGLSRTGPLITGAALIMIGVFGGFASAEIPELSQWGMGLAIGVLLDATIIRVLLVPAAMRWLGAANWYLPSWLEWLPRFDHADAAPSAVADADPEGEREPALA